MWPSTTSTTTTHSSRRRTPSTTMPATLAVLLLTLTLSYTPAVVDALLFPDAYCVSGDANTGPVQLGTYAQQSTWVSTDGTTETVTYLLINQARHQLVVTSYCHPATGVCTFALVARDLFLADSSAATGSGNTDSHLLTGACASQYDCWFQGSAAQPLVPSLQPGFCETTRPVVTCNDGMHNGYELGVDCGGFCPNACGTTTTTSTTPSPTCFDGIKNGLESGVDCGGFCAPCLLDVTTTTPPSCADGVQNGLESGVDCGGLCAPCAADATIGSCFDGIMNNDEEGPDCGGACLFGCPASCSEYDCPAHMMRVANAATVFCSRDSICTSFVCCEPRRDTTTCNNGVMDADDGEIGVDCGGPVCAACDSTQLLPVGCPVSGDGSCSVSAAAQGVDTCRRLSKTCCRETCYKSRVQVLPSTCPALGDNTCGQRCFNLGQVCCLYRCYMPRSVGTVSGSNFLNVVRFSFVDPELKTVRLHNYGDFSVDVTRYIIAEGTRYINIVLLWTDYGVSQTSFPPGASVTLNLGNAHMTLRQDYGRLALFANDDDQRNPNNMLDFVQWGMSAHGHEDTAVTAQMWSAGTFVAHVPPLTFSCGDTMAFGVGCWLHTSSTTRALPHSCRNVNQSGSGFINGANDRFVDDGTCETRCTSMQPPHVCCQYNCYHTQHTDFGPLPQHCPVNGDYSCPFGADANNAANMVSNPNNPHAGNVLGVGQTTTSTEFGCGGTGKTCCQTKCYTPATGSTTGTGSTATVNGPRAVVVTHSARQLPADCAPTDDHTCISDGVCGAVSVCCRGVCHPINENAPFGTNPTPTLPPAPTAASSAYNDLLLPITCSTRAEGDGSCYGICQLFAKVCCNKYCYASTPSATTDSSHANPYDPTIGTTATSHAPRPATCADGADGSGDGTCATAWTTNICTEQEICCDTRCYVRTSISASSGTSGSGVHDLELLPATCSPFGDTTCGVTTTPQWTTNGLVPGVTVPACEPPRVCCDRRCYNPPMARTCAVHACARGSLRPDASLVFCTNNVCTDVQCCNASGTLMLLPYSCALSGDGTCGKTAGGVGRCVASGLVCCLYLCYLPVVNAPDGMLLPTGLTNDNSNVNTDGLVDRAPGGAAQQAFICSSAGDNTCGQQCAPIGKTCCRNTCYDRDTTIGGALPSFCSVHGDGSCGGEVLSGGGTSATVSRCEALFANSGRVGQPYVCCNNICYVETSVTVSARLPQYCSVLGDGSCADRCEAQQYTCCQRRCYVPRDGTAGGRDKECVRVSGAGTERVNQIYKGQTDGQSGAYTSVPNTGDDPDSTEGADIELRLSTQTDVTGAATGFMLLRYQIVDRRMGGVVLYEAVAAASSVLTTTSDANGAFTVTTINKSAFRFTVPSTTVNGVAPSVAPAPAFVDVVCPTALSYVPPLPSYCAPVGDGTCSALDNCPTPSQVPGQPTPRELTCCRGACYVRPIVPEGGVLPGGCFVTGDNSCAAPCATGRACCRNVCWLLHTSTSSSTAVASVELPLWCNAGNDGTCSSIATCPATQPHCCRGICYALTLLDGGDISDVTVSPACDKVHGDGSCGGQCVPRARVCCNRVCHSDASTNVPTTTTGNDNTLPSTCDVAGDGTCNGVCVTFGAVCCLSKCYTSNGTGTTTTPTTVVDVNGILPDDCPVTGDSTCNGACAYATNQICCKGLCYSTTNLFAELPAYCNANGDGTCGGIGIGSCAASGTVCCNSVCYRRTSALVNTLGLPDCVQLTGGGIPAVNQHYQYTQRTTSIALAIYVGAVDSRYELAIFATKDDTTGVPAFTWQLWHAGATSNQPTQLYQSGTVGVHGMFADWIVMSTSAVWPPPRVVSNCNA